MKLEYDKDKLTELMKMYIKSEYNSEKQDLDFYFCEPKNAKGWYRITKNESGVKISNDNGNKRDWSKNEKHKNSEVGKPALELLKNKNSITFYFENKIDIYDVIQPDLKVNWLNSFIKSCK
ncbi:MAG: hypothetical protein GY679_04525 [Mycoplasma sp.]|nr:hypothetical protein [Mycoplasma sp.]